MGTVVDGKWRLERLLGWGGTSAVYKAMHRNGNIAALKILHQKLSHDPGVVERFLREGYIANSIKHAAVVTVRDDGVTEDGCAFLILELLEGETLEDRRQSNGGRLTLDELLPLVDQLMIAVSGIHATGFIHRDLRPSNVFFTNDGHLKIIDFGTARAVETVGQLVGQSVLVGAPAFMAPEVAKQEESAIDQRSDVWSVGATIYTLLTGVYAHPERDLEERLAAAASKRVRPIAEVSGWIDRRLADVIDRALAYDRTKRFPTIEALRLELAAAAVEAAPMMRRFEPEKSVLPPPPSVPDMLPQLLILPTPASFASMPVVVDSRNAPAARAKKSHLGICLGVGLAAMLTLVLVLRSRVDQSDTPKRAANAVVSPNDRGRAIATIPEPARVDVERFAITPPVVAPKPEGRRQIRDAGVAAALGPIDELDALVDHPPQEALPLPAEALVNPGAESAPTSPKGGPDVLLDAL